MAATEKVWTEKFVANFVAVFKAKDFDGDGRFKFGLTAVFPAGTNLKPLEKIIADAAAGKWGAKPPKFRHPLRPSDEERADIEGFPKGSTFTTLSTLEAPGVVSGSNERLTKEDEFYSGCFARATVSAYAYDNKGNKGVALGLHNVQRLGKGPRLDGRIPPEKDFADKVVTEVDVDGDEEFLNS